MTFYYSSPEENNKELNYSHGTKQLRKRIEDIRGFGVRKNLTEKMLKNS